MTNWVSDPYIYNKMTLTIMHKINSTESWDIYKIKDYWFYSKTFLLVLLRPFSIQTAGRQLWLSCTKQLSYFHLLGHFFSRSKLISCHLSCHWQTHQQCKRIKLWWDEIQHSLSTSFILSMNQPKCLDLWLPICEKDIQGHYTCT